MSKLLRFSNLSAYWELIKEKKKTNKTTPYHRMHWMDDSVQSGLLLCLHVLHRCKLKMSIRAFFYPLLELELSMYTVSFQHKCSHTIIQYWHRPWYTKILLLLFLVPSMGLSIYIYSRAIVLHFMSRKPPVKLQELLTYYSATCRT